MFKKYSVYVIFVVTRSRQEITYKFFSLKTLKHCVWYFAPMMAATLLYNTEIMQDQQKIYMEIVSKENVIDQMSQYIIIIFSVRWSFFPFLMASGLPLISELALATDLKFPKNGGSILLALALLLAAQLLGESIVIQCVSILLHILNISLQQS